MRLAHLTITRFKNLQDFSIDFDQRTSTTVIVGRNGSGKSNLLEALTIIFRDLDLGAPPAFEYQLKYVCRKREIHIDAKPDRSRPLVITVDGENLPKQDLKGSDYLPNFVFGYYSGMSERMEMHYRPHQKKFYDEVLLEHSENPFQAPLRRLFFARPEIHSYFVLLAFFTERNRKTLAFLRKHLRIEGLDTILFVMQKPPWKSKRGDPRFWNAAGVVRQLLGNIYAAAIAPLRAKELVNLDFRRRTNLETLYLFIKDRAALDQVADTYDSQQDFFKALESSYISQLLKETRVRVKVRNVDNSLTIRELSEGEQQLLMVLGLMRFTREDETLFLLDEPDTHLNPAWALEYMDHISEVVGKQRSSQVLMTTHDPLTISSLTRNQVRILYRDDKTGLVSSWRPESDPRGMGIGTLLTSDLYGLRSQLDAPTLRLLDKKRKLATKRKPSKGDKAALTKLNHELDQLNGVDFADEVKDPLYSEYVKQMSLLEDKMDLQQPVLTNAQRRQREELAEKTLRAILQK